MKDVLESVLAGEDTIDNDGGFEVEEIASHESPIVTENLEDSYPPMYSAGWSNFVLQNLTDQEKDEKGNPRCDGLRRITQLLVGRIKVSHTEVLTHEQSYALVKHEIVLQEHDTNIEVVVSDVAEVSPANTEPKFLKHPVATASTRAEGRCLRKILCLTNVYTSEEASSENVDKPFKPVDGSQTSFMDMMGKKLNINVRRMVDKYKVDNKVSKVGYDEATEVCQILNIYKQKKQAIPDELIGYDPNWRTTKDARV